MTCNELYISALRKVGEVAADDRAADYAERAPYLLASVISDLVRLDAQYRLSLGEEPPAPFAAAYISLDDEFPLHARFAGAVSDYLASYLVADEDDRLSDRFFDAFCRAVARLVSEIPAERQKILDMYED